MKIGIISDTHIGDKNSTIIKGTTSGNYQTSDKFDALTSRIFDNNSNKPLDYLILNGDILDFAINSFHGACIQARPFFQKIKERKLADHIIYIPGNHDKDIWDALEWNVNVTMKMENNLDPTEFIRKQTGVLDLNIPFPDLDTEKGFSLDKINNPSEDSFIYGLFKDHKKEDQIQISIVYPNLYIKAGNENILITHGHLLEQAWTIASELFQGIGGIPPKVGLEEIEAYNTPITSMICTALGQSGNLTTLLAKLESQIYMDDYTLLETVVSQV
ncbi:MAG: metallophosphoesterase, partial [Nitrospirae bacterium]|nr:metallophosphoesterase [Nitrospirota bacterium]